MVSEALRELESKRPTITDGLRRELASIRTGRATPALVENVKVDYAGVPTPLRQVAGITVPAANLLVIQPWDPGGLSAVEKAILKSDLGLTPSNDGKVIRLTIPPLSEERRQELVKAVHKRIEERKIAIRNLRRDTLEKLKTLEKNKEISQDDLRRAQEQLQKITDSLITATEQIGKEKETELMQV
ncbi:MAG: ribosome recycling factor [Chloroflexi bacterium]|nr:ribosome recycling factor [Chloroflexota bacterium]